MFYKKKGSIIGLWILIAVVLLYLGITYLKGLSVLNNDNTYYVRFPNVSGVANASPVKINGYKVGSVQDLHFEMDHEGSTILALDIDKRYKLPIDTKASINVALLGGSEIVLDLGASKEILNNKDTIQPAKEKPDYMAMLNEEVIPFVLSMLPKADSILSAINKLTNDPSLASSIQDLTGTIASANKTAHNLQLISQRLETFSQKELPRISSNLGTFAENMGAASSALDSAKVAEMVTELTLATASLQEISKKLENSLNDNSNSLGALINEKSLYMRIDSLVKATDELITDIKKNPKRYLRISVF